MNVLTLFRNHTHYWSVPQVRAADNRLIQICYECGAEREVKVEIRPSASCGAISLEEERIRTALGY